MEPFCRRKRSCAGEVFDLVPTGEPRSHDGAGVVADGRCEYPFGDRLGYLVVAPFVTERTGHATATSVQVGNLDPGNAREQFDGRPGPHEGFLMAVTVVQNGFGVFGSKRHPGNMVQGPLLKCQATPGNLFRRGTMFRGHKPGQVINHRGPATGLIPR